MVIRIAQEQDGSGIEFVREKKLREHPCDIGGQVGRVIKLRILGDIYVLDDAAQKSAFIKMIDQVPLYQVRTI